MYMSLLHKLQVEKHGVLLYKRELDFEIKGVLNPALIVKDDNIHLFYRAVSNSNYSTICHCLLSDPITVAHRDNFPILVPEFPYEIAGIEDPRISMIDDLYYLSYTAYDGYNALGALALSDNLKDWKKIGVISPRIQVSEFEKLLSNNTNLSNKYKRYNIDTYNAKIDQDRWLWDKNVVFFPRRINGEICFLHRIKPDIQIVTGLGHIDDLTSEFWDNYFLHFQDQILMTLTHEHEISYIGAGAPPIETPFGWLLIYHSVYDTIQDYIYCVSAALLDIDEPRKLLATLPYPLFVPDLPYEMVGEVDNVCFPTATLLRGDRLYIYYGAADTSVAVASVSLNGLLIELLKAETSS